MNDCTLTLTRLLAARPDAIWRCWTEPALMVQWFAPKPVETLEAEIDPRPGGIFRTVMRVPDHGDIAPPPGCVLVADPDKRLVWTNALGPGFVPCLPGTDDMSFAFTAEILLAPESDGTRYSATVWHATPQDTKKHADMGFEPGWGAATTQLEALAQTL